MVCIVGVLLEAFAGPTQGGEVGWRVAEEELVGSGGGREEGCTEHGFRELIGAGDGECKARHRRRAVSLRASRWCLTQAESTPPAYYAVPDSTLARLVRG